MPVRVFVFVKDKALFEAKISYTCKFRAELIAKIKIVGNDDARKTVSVVKKRQVSKRWSH